MSRRQEYHGRSRLVRIASHDASVWRTNSDFEVDMGNTLSEITSGINGLSVESCGFKNDLPNVKETATEKPILRIYPTIDGDTFPDRDGALRFDVAVPTGWYETQQLLGILNESLADVWPTPEAPAFKLEEKLDRVMLVMDPVSPQVNGFIISGVPSVATMIQQLGWPIDPTFPETVYPSTDGVLIAPHLTNIQGEQVVFLHSSILCAGQQAVDGEGRLTSILTAIPVKVERGLSEWYAPEQDEGPTIIYDRPLPLNSINITLRDVRGAALDIGSGELWVLLRFWW